MIKVVVGNNVKRESVIVDSNTTPRKVLEEAGVDYTRGTMHLDGASLQPGDLDKTFESFGITEKCFLLNVVKADNAASVTVVGDAVVIKSELTLEDLEKVAEYRPKALILYGGEDGKEPIFRVSVGENGSINEYGATFAGQTHDEAKKATITKLLPCISGCECDIRDAVAGAIGSAILNLNKIEAKIPEVLSEIEAERAEVLEHISIA